MKKINLLLPHAMVALRQSELILPDGVSILKEYDGYAAAFAPSVITAGLKATLSFYTDKHKMSGEDAGKPRRFQVLKVLLAIYRKKYESGGALPGDDLLDIALRTAAGSPDERRLKNDLIDAATALKLAMRNFRQAKDEHDLLTQTPAAP